MRREPRARTSPGATSPSRPSSSRAYPDGLTTAEVAHVCRGRNDPPDLAGTLAELTSLAESGAIRRSPIGDDGSLWHAAA